ncbi:MAG: phosphonate ABC transporter ATP-binding protein [Tissierellia bacterium]|jgi:phosphonate transport system ATP-binding protein|nr:phosphonate ABC transporter ATP-binding protein [Tissierellia bacterium]
MELLEIKHISKVYPNGVRALEDVSFTVEKGEFVSIIGLSGAGKSTLLRSINKLVEISSGEILFEGKNIALARGKDLRLMRRDMGMVFQSFNLVKRSKVITNVLAGRIAYHSSWRSILGLFPKEDKEIAFKALQRVNILEKSYSRADQLSGGQMQRVAIARSLAQEPKLLLADEPVASLDPLTTIQVMDDLKRINRELGITTLVNLHHVDLALKYSSRIIGLREGRLVFDGPAKDVDDSILELIYGRQLLSNEIFGEEHEQ